MATQTPVALSHARASAHASGMRTPSIERAVATIGQNVSPAPFMARPSTTDTAVKANVKETHRRNELPWATTSGWSLKMRTAGSAKTKNTTPTTVVDAVGALTPLTTYLFDTLKTTTDDAAYTRDDDGYNFKHTYDGTTSLDEGGKLFLMEYKFVLISLPDKFVYFRVKTLSAWSQ